jgi:hypothetical protein
MSSLTDTIKNSLAAGAIFCLLCLASAGYCQDTALMLEVSPVNGGTLNFSTGVHNFDRDAAVTLTAIPKPGYQFVYWIGSVHNAANSTTIVSLDSPKIVIAVFERSRFDWIDIEEPAALSLGSGGPFGSAGDIAAGLEQAGGAKRPSKFHWPKPPEPPDEFPVPEGDDENNEDFPVPVPEPATITILLTGMLVIAGRRNRRTFTS